MLILESQYAKKIGLPGYSSHQFAVTLRTELTDLSQLEKTTADLYQRLQAAVDSQIINPGLVPSSNGGQSAPAPTPRITTPAPREEEQWKCSEKQQALILKIVAEANLDNAAVDALAQERFGAGVRQLNKLQASSLIDELADSQSMTLAEVGVPTAKKPRSLREPGAMPRQEPPAVPRSSAPTDAPASERSTKTALARASA